MSIVKMKYKDKRLKAANWTKVNDIAVILEDNGRLEDYSKKDVYSLQESFDLNITDARALKALIRKRLEND